MKIIDKIKLVFWVDPIGMSMITVVMIVYIIGFIEVITH